MYKRDARGAIFKETDKKSKKKIKKDLQGERVCDNIDKRSGERRGH